MFYDVYMKLCEDRGEKPYQLVLNLGAKSNGVVAQWAKGSTPRNKMLQAVAEYFDVPVAYLLTGDESLLEKKRPATTVTDEKRERAVQILMSASREEVEDYLSYMEWKRSRKGD